MGNKASKGSANKKQGKAVATQLESPADKAARQRANAKKSRDDFVKFTIQRTLESKKGTVLGGSGYGAVVAPPFNFGSLLNRLKELQKKNILHDDFFGEKRSLRFEPDDKGNRKVHLTNTQDYTKVQHLVIKMAEFKTVVLAFVDFHLQSMRQTQPGLAVQAQVTVQGIQDFIESM